MTKKTKIIVADDHPHTCDYLREKLAVKIPLLEIVADLRRGSDLEAAVAEHKPDLLILDLQMEPGFDPMQTIESLKKIQPSLKIVIFSAHSDPEVVIEMLKLGAHGYAYKGEPFTELVRCVNFALADQTWYSPGLIHGIVSLLGEELAVSFIKQEQLLTEREQQVLQCIADFLATDEIAGKLAVSERTVQADITSAIRKLNADNRLGAVVRALRGGLIK